MVENAFEEMEERWYAWRRGAWLWYFRGIGGVMQNSNRVQIDQSGEDICNVW